MPTWTKPVTLVANTNENVNDLNAVLDDIYARANGGLDETNVPNLTAAFTSYKHYWGPLTAILNASAVAGTYAVGATTLTNSPFLTVLTTQHVRVLDPALFAANARTTKYRLRLTVISNNTAPGINFSATLQQVTGFAGGAGATPVVNAAVAVTGSTAAVNGLLAGTYGLGDSGDFTAPTAANYAVVVATSGALAANAAVTLAAELLVRQV